MMDWTDRHCRVFHRLMTRRGRLYTEMLTTGAILHGHRQRLLGFDPSEHPVALQLGGSNARDLATAAKIGQDFGYDEINLNVGCPSDRVQDGRFGACLMAEPALVADCVEAMKRAVRIPVTVKCRIGIDDQDPDVALNELARGVIAVGADALIVVAGMDGALPSVVAGLVDVPVIGLPTSVGYGLGGGGVAALLSMLQTCAPGLVVVNIDNGVGAGATAALFANRVARARA